MPIRQISAIELRDRLQSDQPPVLLDVRQPEEFAYARIDGSVLIPLHLLPIRFSELDADREIAVICHHGMRSQQAAFFLDRQGFKHILNLSGGIDAWSRNCDPSVPTY
ncbi:MAG: rhodanese-like domain-containing protein [Methylomicrobium sp.]